MTRNSHNEHTAALALILLVVAANCRAMLGSCRCGAEVTQQVRYTGPSAHLWFPYPKVAGVSRDDGKSEIKLQLSLKPGDSTKRSALKTLDQGATWVADPDPTPEWWPSSDPSIFYRANNKVYFRSTNQGKEWVELQLLVDGHSKEAFVRQFSQSPSAQLSLALAAVHPRNVKTLFGTLKVWVYSFSGDTVSQIIEVPGMYVSYDGGDNWTSFSRTVGNVRNRLDNPPTLGISASNPKLMITPGHEGLMRTWDGGRSWSPVGQQAELERPAEQEGRAAAIAELRRKGVTTPIPKTAPVARFQVSQIEFQPDDSSVVYLVSNKGLYRSKDGGDSWCLFLWGAPKLDSITSLTFDPGNPRQLFVATETTVMISSDGGCTFRKFFDYEQFSARYQVGTRVRPWGAPIL